MLKAFPFTNYHNWQLSALQPFLSHERVERVLGFTIGRIHGAGLNRIFSRIFYLTKN